MAHDLPWTLGSHSNVAWRGYGGWGVELFFALSGVLICWRMMEEETRVGRLRLKDFYTRRLFRIQPAAYTYLAVILLLGMIGSVPFSWRYWASSALSYANFLVTASTPPGAPAFVGHFWTLSVEEHFYILVSLLFFFFRPARRILALGTLLVLLFSAQSFAARHGAFSPVASPRRTYWIIQLLLLPSLFTLLVRMPRVKKFVVRFGAPSSVAFLILVAMVVNQKLEHRGLRSLLHQGRLDFIVSNGFILIYGFGLIVISIMLHPKSLTTRFLEWTPLRSVGRWSYSIYLWHVLFFIPVFLGAHAASPAIEFLSGRPWKYIATAIASLASYYYIEKPFIRLGHRLAPPVTSGHADLNVAPLPQHSDGLQVVS